MLLDFDTLSPAQAYFHTVQTLIPRPIAWILSENSQGRYNLAPFSYFTAVSSQPPLLMFSAGRHPGGRDKDTLVNIRVRHEFVVHIATTAQVGALNASAETLDETESEVDKIGLETVPFEGFSLPRVADAPLAYGCECFEISAIGDVPQQLVFGRIRRLYVSDELCRQDDQGRWRVDAEKLDPLSRLGANQYAGLGPVIHLQRPG